MKRRFLIGLVLLFLILIPFSGNTTELYSQQIFATGMLQMGPWGAATTYTYNWTNALPVTIYITKVQVWSGAIWNSRGDLRIEVTRPTRMTVPDTPMNLVWLGEDHYVESTGIGSRMYEENYSPNWVSIMSGESLNLLVWGHGSQPEGSMFQVGIRVQIWYFLL